MSLFRNVTTSLALAISGLIWPTESMVSETHMPKIKIEINFPEWEFKTPRVDVKLPSIEFNVPDIKTPVTDKASKGLILAKELACSLGKCGLIDYNFEDLDPNLPSSLLNIIPKIKDLEQARISRQNLENMPFGLRTYFGEVVAMNPTSPHYVGDLFKQRVIALNYDDFNHLKPNSFDKAGCKEEEVLLVNIGPVEGLERRLESKSLFKSWVLDGLVNFDGINESVASSIVIASMGLHYRNFKGEVVNSFPSEEVLYKLGLPQFDYKKCSILKR